MVALTRVSSSRLHRDYKATAKVASLLHVVDSIPGISRIKKGTGFTYLLSTGNTVKDKDTLIRIKKLAIPPAWTDVWICEKDNGHIQATGFDVKHRKQYKYHTQWNEVRNQTKFHRLTEFGNCLPALRRKIESDIASTTLTKDKVLATVVSLMEKTFIRVGNSEYEKLYGSYGLTTLKDGHVKIDGGTIQFSFKGKKGIHHAITLKNKRLAKIVKACRDIPGKELFQYVDENGIRCSIDSGMVNNYIREATGKEFTAKDFRTSIVAMGIIITWALLGPVFDYSDTWQLFINTGTTIITFLMVFIIQQSQNKDTVAIHLKLNELIASQENASNRLIDVEDLTEEELAVLKKFYVKLSSLALKENDLYGSHSIDEAEKIHKSKNKESKKKKAA
jgi:DNA topoisomerase I